jgi:MtN3 and saliva related transmembrane protein
VIVVLGYLAALLTTGAAVPQVVQTWRSHEVRGISVPYWVILSSGVALWLVYGLSIGDGPLVAANAVSLALDLTVLWLTFRYRSLR